MRPPSLLTRSLPGAFTFIALVVLVCGSFFLAGLPRNGPVFAVPFLFGVAIHAMAASGCRERDDLRGARSLVIASIGVLLTVTLTAALLVNPNNYRAFHLNYGATLVAAGIRPVIAAFYQERIRARVDSKDVFFTTVGIWVMVCGVAISMRPDGRAPATATLAYADWLGQGLAYATLALGAALSLQGLIRARLRRRWFRRVAEGKISGYRLGVPDETVAVSLSRLLDDSSRDVEAHRLVLFRGAETGYRGQAPEALGVVSIDPSPWRLTRAELWVMEVVVGIMMPFVFTGWIIH